MPASGKHFEGFKPHTRFKHAILEEYLVRWARVLGLGRHSRLRIVDACAGRGRDEMGNEGSPLRIARIAADAMQHLGNDFQTEVLIDVLAIEKKDGYFRALRSHLAPFGERVSVVKGTLADYLDEHFAMYDTAPTLFFIDPFGVAPIDADVIRRALKGPKNEVFLLFADQAALRHLGALHADALAPEDHALVRRARERESQRPLDMFDTLEEADAPGQNEVEQALRRAEVSVRSTERGRRASKAILDRAFGGEFWAQAIDAAPRSERRLAFVRLYEKTLRSLGAAYVLPIPIFGDDDRIVYHLMYGTKSPTGMRKMKEAVEDARKKTGNTDDEAEGSLSLMAAETAYGRILEHWAGKSAAWVTAGRVLGLRDWCLSEVPEFYPRDGKELKRMLARHRRAGSTLLYDIPPEP